MSRKIYDGHGLFSRGSIILEIEEDGSIYAPGALNTREYVGHVDDRGYIYKGRGVHNDYVGRIDQQGNLFDNGPLRGNYVGNLSSDGLLRDNSPLIGGYVTDSVGLGLSQKKDTSKVEHHKKRATNGEGLENLPDLLLYILGGLFIALVAVFIKVIKGVLYYANAVEAFFKYTDGAKIITIAAVLIPFVLILFIDGICKSKFKENDSKNGFAAFWAKNISDIIYAFFAVYLLSLVLIMSVLALDKYIPPVPKDTSGASIEQDVFTMQDIYTYRDYMQKLDNTSWHSAWDDDNLKIHFKYTSDPNNQGYVIDGEATINGEPYKYSFFIDSAGENDDGLGCSYTLYKQEIDDGTAICLFYEKEYDVLTNYDDMELVRDYESATDKIKWSIIKWIRQTTAFISGSNK